MPDLQGGNLDLSDEHKPEPKMEFQLLPETKEAPFTDNFIGFDEGLAKCEPGGFVLTPEFCRHFHEFTGFKTRKDDIWVLSFPKCGISPFLFHFIKILFRF